MPPMRRRRQNSAPVAAAAKREPAGEHGTLSAMPIEHKPVLAAELVALLAPEPGQIAVDCTFGAGGHARLVAAGARARPGR